MNAVPRSRPLFVSGCLVVALAVSAMAGEVLTPVKDADGKVIGTFETWKKKKVGGKKLDFPVGWVVYLHGYEGKALVKRVKGSEGLALKGTVQQVNHHGDRAQIPPRTEAGKRFEPFQNFQRGDGVPIATRHAKVRFKYQFHAKNGSSFFFFLRLYKAGVEIGQATFRAKDEVDEWQTVEETITYFNNEVPDRCYISFDILGKQNGNFYGVPAKGSFYVIDDVTFVD